MLPRCTTGRSTGNACLLDYLGPLSRYLIHLSHSPLSFGGLCGLLVPLGLCGHHSPDYWVVHFRSIRHILLRSRPTEALLDDDTFSFSLFLRGCYGHLGKRKPAPFVERCIGVHVNHHRREPSVPEQPVEDTSNLDICCSGTLGSAAPCSCCFHFSICPVKPADRHGLLSGRGHGPYVTVRKRTGDPPCWGLALWRSTGLYK